MYSIILYQMPKSKRWRWKLAYNNKCLARSDYHYASKIAAKRAFESMLSKAVTQFEKDHRIPYREE